MSALSDEIEQAVARALRPLLERLDAQRPAGLDPTVGLGVLDAARHAHRGPETVRRAIRSGALRATRPDGSREWVISAGDLERWLGRSRSSPVIDLAEASRQALARAVGGRG